MPIIQLEQYLQIMEEADFAFLLQDREWVCTQSNGYYSRLLQGESIKEVKSDLSNIKLHDVTIDFPETNLSNHLSLFLDSSNRFENTGYISNETYQTPIVAEEVSNTVTTSNTTGYKFTEKISASSKFKAKIPIIGDSENTVGIEVSFEQNISTTTTESDTTKVTVTVPSQQVVVRPRTRKIVTIQLYRLESPYLSTSSSGYATGSVSRGDIYDILSNINTKCPQIYVNRDDRLTLDSTRRALRFRGAGMAKVSAVSLDYVIITREEDLDTGAVISINNDVRRARIQE